MSPEAIAHLERRDRVLRRVIRTVGPCTLVPMQRRSPFQSLVQAVAHQQLHRNAANAILKRFCLLVPGRKFPRPIDVLALSDNELRATGFSQAKILAIRDIAAKTVEGVVPTARAIQKLDDDEIIERLVQVRGVGRWTVEMLLIFQLGRTDVLPVDDFGIRQGFSVAYKLDRMPTPRELREHGERWAPYRTTAAWYLWRIADLSKKPSEKVTPLKI